MALSNEEILIRSATLADAPAIAGIYNHYVAKTIITFEEEPVSDQDMERRIGQVQSVSLPWLVAERDGTVQGFAYAGRWKDRSAYRFAVETTVYLDADFTGRGIGTRLYGDLLPLLDDRKMRVVIGGIALPNEASVSLHEKLGFKKVAHFNKVGFKFNRWIDVGYWEYMLGGDAA